MTIRELKERVAKIDPRLDGRRVLVGGSAVDDIGFDLESIAEWLAQGEEVVIVITANDSVEGTKLRVGRGKASRNRVRIVQEHAYGVSPTASKQMGAYATGGALPYDAFSAELESKEVVKEPAAKTHPVVTASYALAFDPQKFGRIQEIIRRVQKRMREGDR